LIGLSSPGAVVDLALISRVNGVFDVLPHEDEYQRPSCKWRPLRIAASDVE
jgi:hypothetical protein